MKAEDYYPNGAYSDTQAPYNEPTNQERDFLCGVTITLTKDVTITTDNYIREYDYEDGNTYANTKNTDWATEYKELCYSIPKLLSILKGYVKKDLERNENGTEHKHTLKKILESCDGWYVEELHVEEL